METMKQKQILMSDSLRISMIQAPITWEDRDRNLAYYGRLLRRVSGKTDLAVLPETFTTGFSMNVEALGDAPDGLTVATLKDWAQKYHTALAGSFIAKEEGRYYNRGFFITPEGETSYYDKRHLFRMAGEAEHFTPGTKQAIVSYRGWNICLQVCYDLRFPLWSRNVNNAYDLLIYVANWPEVRIQVWNTLLPARAIENLAYVCGVNRTGTDGGGYSYNGQSAIYSPKGEKLTDAGTRREIVRTCTLQKSDLERLRSRFPAWQDADAFTLQTP
jgi:predicted amidohydrolase